MNLTAALFAISLLQAPAPQAEVLNIAGRKVALTFPKGAAKELPADVLAWDGFKYLPADGRTSPVVTYGVDWSRIEADYKRLAAQQTADTPVWRVKAFVLTRVDLLEKDSRGVTIHRRPMAFNVDEALADMARFAALATVQTGGKVKFTVDAQLDNDTVFLPAAGFSNDEFVSSYVGPRVNAGKFEPTEGGYRGPYHSVFVIHPLSDSRHFNFVVNRNPVSVLSLNDPVGMARSMYSAFADWHLAEAARKQGLRGYREGVDAITPLGLRNPNVVLSETALVDATKPEEASVDVLSRSKGETRSEGMASVTAGPYEFQPSSYATDTVTLTLADDPAQGKVLHYTERSNVRTGLAGLPIPSGGIQVQSGSKLSLMAKTSSRDPIAILARTGSEWTAFELGGPEGAAVFPSDGKWHQVVFDLSSLAGKTIHALAIGPSARQAEIPKFEALVLEFDFDDIAITQEGAPTAKVAYTANAASPVPYERALAAVSGPNPLLADPDDTVRLNALLAAHGNKTPEVLAAAMLAAKHVNPRIAEAGIANLMAQGTDAATGEVRRLLTQSPFDATRRAAALALAQTKDPQLAGQISLLFGRNSWVTRLAGAQALGQLPGKEPAVILMTFLQETNPQILLTVTQLSNPEHEVVRKRLLFTAVNDPSDVVRAAAYIKLLESNNESVMAEARKGALDDGVLVRLAVLDYFEKHPSEANRGVIRQAVVDSYPSIRAAALRAFATLPNPVTTEEFSNVLNDRHPVVQSALIELAKKKGIALPSATLEQLRASIDSDVARRAGELGG